MCLPPPWSEPLARPFGCLSFADASNSLAEFAAPHETTTTSPVTVSVEPSRSITTSVTDVPSGFVCSRTAGASVSRVTFGDSRAGRTPITSASAFACSGHGKPSQFPQRTHTLVCGVSSSRSTPHGAWNGWRPAAARSSDSCWIRGSGGGGGKGWGGRRGGGEGRARGRRGRPLASGAANLIVALGHRVVRLHVVVADRPGGGDPVG